MSSNPTQISDDYVSENRSGVGGGISDVYGEDLATLDQLFTPWVTSVARSVSQKNIPLAVSLDPNMI